MKATIRDSKRIFESSNVAMTRLALTRLADGGYPPGEVPIMRGRTLLAFAPLLLNATAALAHHSFAAEFDDTKPLKVTGVVTKVEWSNPHIWFYVDVKGDDGKVTNWGFSGGAPGQLMRRNITRSVIKEGMTISVEGYRAKDGSHNGSGGRVTFPDGRSVFTAGSEDSVPDQKKGGK
jgi:hypothetical protein